MRKSSGISKGWHAILCLFLFFSVLGAVIFSSSEAENIQPVSENVSLPSDADPRSTGLEIHFLDVGQADAAILLCDDQVMMIDGGNPGDSSLVYSYLKNTLCIEHIDLMIATHPHDDHIGGLPGALNACSVGAIYSPVVSYDSERFSDLSKYAAKQNIEITVPQIGDTVDFGSAIVEFLWPATLYEDVNDWSLVLRVVYGETSFLFTGDAEAVSEMGMLQNDTLTLDATVLKVGHHGSSSSSTGAFLDAVSPRYAVISVGQDNAYAHPSEEVLDRLAERNTEMYRTDRHGTIICTSDGQSVTFSTEKEEQPVPEDATAAAIPSEAAAAAPTAEPQGTSYVLNTNSRKFHYPHCNSVAKMKDHNKAYFTGTRDELINQGYSPCGNCHP